ncbi:tyrosine-type recombinase/integrase [Gilvimarinus agarilyticus]|uniref:tyrosine-type recombinase/integrase n=1 Tax=Gilvimarinus sp. 2_MG-2023 TaxID=3062666 RepID=UPI001C09DA85|nr:site-specific integrase [Gilvimarinus sp. 2_MG-2023]MBU2886733.1 tyrosine-type recombinase/integrase [Gilvimarinus agarilyticus]MDO6571399.1 tyrosine-type recombinase/integrase [Gilvimarinus sp. 2_MG-2023]
MTNSDNLSAKTVGGLSYNSDATTKNKKAVYNVGPRGLGLYLQCTLRADGSCAKSWLLKIRIGNKRHEVGLGPYAELPLAQARAKARERRVYFEREILLNGVNPVEEMHANKKKARAAQATVITFKEVAEQWLEKRSKEATGKMSDANTQKVWGRIANYALPKLGDLAVNDIETAHVLQVIRPIWEGKHETARKTRGYIENILSFAIAQKLRPDENPARFKGHLDQVLPKGANIQVVKHREALAVDEMPHFMANLREANTVAARALEFLILTATRSDQARSARWEQIDFKAKTWTAKGDDVKTRGVHVVPLSDRALELLEAIPRCSQYMFHSSGKSGYVSATGVLKVAKAISEDTGLTAHGFRSTFADWAATKTDADHDVIEYALAHKVGSETSRAYRRDTLIERRRGLMNQWCEYCYLDS